MLTKKKNLCNYTKTYIVFQASCLVYRLTNAAASLSVEVRRTQPASPPILGKYTLSFQG